MRHFQSLQAYEYLVLNLSALWSLDLPPPNRPCTPPYPDCPICFNAIVPAQPTWSCSPAFVPHDPDSAPPAGHEHEQEQERVQCCWTTFHLKCVRSWAAKSVKDIEDAWRARGESGRKGDWRCPGCQFKRETVPHCYWCARSLL